MIAFTNTYLPAANTRDPYAQSLSVTGAVGAVVFSILSGSLPPGLTISPLGLVSGIASSYGNFNAVLRATDSTAATVDGNFNFLVLDLIALDALSVDQEQFVAQFQAALALRGTWSTGLTTQTSQTLIELVSAMGTYLTGRMVRMKEDAYPETAQSDGAIRAIANMQGLRLSRKLPVTVQAQLTSINNLSISPYTEFSGAGSTWFSDQQIELIAGIPRNLVLKQGSVRTVFASGLGTDLQTWVAQEDGFAVSDQDVQVSIGGLILFKTFGGLWNYSGTGAYADRTLSDGRMMIQFGSQGYGSVPLTSETIKIVYALTDGSVASGLNTLGAKITIASVPTITGVFLASPSGGADEKDALVYKNFAAGTFGTFGSAVTKSQYASIANSYPGVIDSITLAQRETNPQDLRLMNVVQVSALTTSPLAQTDIDQYIKYLQRYTMYSTRFQWQPPLPVDVVVDLTVHCYNSVSSLENVTAKTRSAVTKLFSGRPGILGTDFYISDLVETAYNASPNQISHVEVNLPTRPMRVANPAGPVLTFSLGTGTLPPLSYAYAVSADEASPIVGIDRGIPNNWVYPLLTATGGVTLSWVASPNVIAYNVWGRRSGAFQILSVLPGTATSFTDTGAIADPATQTPFPPAVAIRYNRLLSANLTVRSVYADRQTAALLPIRDVLS